MKTPEMANQQISFFDLLLRKPTIRFKDPAPAPEILNSGKPAELSVKCLRLQIENGAKVTFTPLDLSRRHPEEALEEPQCHDLIYIVEGHSGLVPARLAEMGLQLPPAFFAAHLDRGSGHRTHIEPPPDTARSTGSFFASWSVPARQKPESWKMEKSIRAGRPWDKDQAEDPESLYESHSRWGTFPESLYRSYHPLHPSVQEEREGGVVHHHAKTCMSFYYSRKNGGPLVGCLLVDPRRMHTVREIDLNLWRAKANRKTLPNRPCFLDEMSSLDRVRGALEGAGIFRGRAAETAVIQTILGFVLEDMPTVLFELGRGLDEVELGLGQDQELRSSVPQWRDYLGRWRNTLVHLASSISYMVENYEQLQSQENTSTQMMIWRLRQINAEVKAARGRIETAFQALMSTLSILESQRAIAQAESISKLTQLAFFFIPLSFIAAVFGMNVIVRFSQLPSLSDHQLIQM